MLPIPCRSARLRQNKLADEKRRAVFHTGNKSLEDANAVGVVVVVRNLAQEECAGVGDGLGCVEVVLLECDAFGEVSVERILGLREVDGR
jgi:hypothetical protein